MGKSPWDGGINPANEAQTKEVIRALTQKPSLLRHVFDKLDRMLWFWEVREGEKSIYWVRHDLLGTSQAIVAPSPHTSDTQGYQWQASAHPRDPLHRTPLDIGSGNADTLGEAIYNATEWVVSHGWDLVEGISLQVPLMDSRVKGTTQGRQFVGWCEVCHEKAYPTPSGSSCKNGHGGATLLPANPKTILE